MVLGLVVVDLMDWNGGVYDGWLDSLLLDNWLNVLVNMVVDVLTGDGWSSRCSVLRLANLAGVSELSLLSLKTLSYVVVIAVLDLTVLNTDNVVAVLLWKNLAVLDWLDGGVVMILVNLTVDGSGSLLVLGLGDMLVYNGWVDSLVNSGVLLAVSNSCNSSAYILTCFPSLERKP